MYRGRGIGVSVRSEYQLPSTRSQTLDQAHSLPTASTAFCPTPPNPPASLVPPLRVEFSVEFEGGLGRRDAKTLNHAVLVEFGEDVPEGFEGTEPVEDVSDVHLQKPREDDDALGSDLLYKARS